MTRDELIERLKKSIAGKGKPESGYGEGWIDGMNAALRHVEKLDSPPAMAWQDEPSGEGEHYVEGERCICWVSNEVIFVPTWSAEGECVRVVERSLNGRRVCPIPAAPPLPKRGGA